MGGSRGGKLLNRGQDGTAFSTQHDGGRRCQQEGCTKGAANRRTQFCTAHGGGKGCQQEGCSKYAQDGTGYCTPGRQMLHALGGPTKASQRDVSPANIYWIHKRCATARWCVHVRSRLSSLTEEPGCNGALVGFADGIGIFG